MNGSTLTVNAIPRYTGMRLLYITKSTLFNKMCVCVLELSVVSLFISNASFVILYLFDLIRQFVCSD